MFHYIKLNLIPERVEKLKNTRYFSKILTEGRPFSYHDDMVIFINDSQSNLKINIDSWDSFNSSTKNSITRKYSVKEFSQVASKLDIPKGVLHYVLMCGFDREYVDNVINFGYKKYINPKDLKAGDKVRLRNGTEKIICNICDVPHASYPWVITFEEDNSGENETHHYTKEGLFYDDGETHRLDIMEIVKQDDVPDGGVKHEDTQEKNLVGMFYCDTFGLEFKVKEAGETFLEPTTNKYTKVLTVTDGLRSKFVSFTDDTKEGLYNKIGGTLYYKVMEPLHAEPVHVEPTKQEDSTPVSNAFEDLIKSVLNCR